MVLHADMMRSLVSDGLASSCKSGECKWRRCKSRSRIPLWIKISLSSSRHFTNDRIRRPGSGVTTGLDSSSNKESAYCFLSCSLLESNAVSTSAASVSVLPSLGAGPDPDPDPVTVSVPSCLPLAAK